MPAFTALLLGTKLEIQNIALRMPIVGRAKCSLAHKYISLYMFYLVIIFSIVSRNSVFRVLVMNC